MTGAGVMAKTVFRARASNFYGNLDRGTASVIHGQRGQLKKFKVFAPNLKSGMTNFRY